MFLKLKTVKKNAQVRNYPGSFWWKANIKQHGATASFLFFFKTGSLIAQANLELAIYPRLSSNSQFSCVSLLRAGITGMSHHSQLVILVSIKFVLYHYLSRIGYHIKSSIILRKCFNRVCQDFLHHCEIICYTCYSFQRVKALYENYVLEISPNYSLTAASLNYLQTLVSLFSPHIFDFFHHRWFCSLNICILNLFHSIFNK
jgi:hypothetical protein